MERWPLSKLFEYICTRPLMFVEANSFDLVAAYLTGYVAGGGLSPEERDQWVAFRTWLADRCWRSAGLARNLCWQAYVKHLYEGDAARLEHLPGLFAECLAWRESGGDPPALVAQWLEYRCRRRVHKAAQRIEGGKVWSRSRRHRSMTI